MAKDYVITSGEYSDYHICAVTLDPKRAEKMKKFYDKADYTGACIEEFDTDEGLEKIEAGYMPYRVTFTRVGDVYSVVDEYSLECSDRVWEAFNGCVCVTVWAKDKESAVKIAAERRAKYLAEKEGIA